MSDVRIGVIGCGYWGPNIIRNFAESEGASVVRVCDVDASRLEPISRRYPAVDCTTDASEVIGARDVDAVAVVTPVSTHYDLASKALAAGQHVFVEKPITADPAQAELLCDVAEKKGLTLMVGHVFEYSPAVTTAKDLLPSCGKVYYVDSSRVNLGLHQSDISVLWDLAPHDMSIILYWLGAEPVAVHAVGECYAQPGIEDVVFVTMRFADSMIAHVHVSWLAPSKLRRTTIVGSRKMLVYEDTQSVEKVKVYDRGVSFKNTEDYRRFLPEYRSGDIVSPHVATSEPLRIECGHFIECVRSGDTPRSDGRSGLRVVRVLAAADRSLKNEGKAVRL